MRILGLVLCVVGFHIIRSVATMPSMSPEYWWLCGGLLVSQVGVLCLGHRL